MKIVRATAVQQQQAQDLLNEYYEAIAVMHRDTSQDVERFLSDTTAGMWIAYVEDKPAGCVVLRPLPSIVAAAECKRLYVRPDFRGRHIAEALLDAMEAEALDRGMDWIYLDSNDTLKAALRLYEKRAYRTCERYNDNPQATVFMRKALRT